jgi:hypothetical protein
LESKSLLPADGGIRQGQTTAKETAEKAGKTQTLDADTVWSTVFILLTQGWISFHHASQNHHGKWAHAQLPDSASNHQLNSSSHVLNRA